MRGVVRLCEGADAHKGMRVVVRWIVGVQSKRVCADGLKAMTRQKVVASRTCG